MLSRNFEDFDLKIVHKIGGEVKHFIKLEGFSAKKNVACFAFVAGDNPWAGLDKILLGMDMVYAGVDIRAVEEY